MQTEIEKKEPAKKQLTIRQLIEGDAFREQIAKALPKHLTPDRFIRISVTALTRAPKLMQCEQVSLFNSLLTLSQLGLEPDGRNAHLIPFENRKRGVTECQLIIDYKGLVELAMRSGVVSNLHAEIICENDEFEYDRGIVTKHKIDIRKPRGKSVGAWAVCHYKDGSSKYEVMSDNEIEAVRTRSKAANAGPWVTDKGEMQKKTVFRRLSKWIPFSPEIREGIEVDDNQFSPIEGLTIKPEPINTSRVEAMKQKYVEKEVNIISKEYIEESLKNAKTIDALNEALDLSNSLENEEERKELATLFETRKKELLSC